MAFYAHSRSGRQPFEWQPLETHLKNVAECADQFAKFFQSSDWAWNAGWIHDIGKADRRFQAYLLRENGLDDSEYDDFGSGRVNHSSAGAALACEKLGISGRILAYISAGHHAGLPDWFPADTGNAALKIRLQEGKTNLERIRSHAEETFLKLRTTSRPPGYVKSDNLHLWVRMLYSCLVDADYLDTEAFMQPDQTWQRFGFAEISALKELFDNHMDKVTTTCEKTDVNAIRQEILALCRTAAAQSPGLFSLAVPTGGGKTLSSMAFALDHAVEHKKRRVIYVIPYTSIIEQTAGIFAGIFGSSNVVEHHSNLAPQRETPRSVLASENWDAPIIVTTNVQFFESLYGAKSSRCRKLHNIVNSVVILDEAQLLPPELLTPCVDVMNQLVRNYGVTIVLSTATQPALPKLDKMKEIIPSSAKLYERLKRVVYQFPDFRKVKPVTWADLAMELKQHDQVLCVVNTRRDCYELFNLMPQGTIHLSALMCGMHRSAVIRLIRCRLRRGLPTRVISTQLVEAGVDIDFPVVYRALAGLPSIAQVAGRCNREGKLNKEGRLGIVHVFVPPKPAPRGLLLKGENTTRELCSMPEFEPQLPQTLTRYFELFYSRINDTGSQFSNWLVRDVNPDLFLQFRTADENFNIIDDQAQRPVIVRYGKSEKLLAQLRFAGPTRSIMRQLQRYMVNLPTSMVDTMRNNGLMEEVEPRKAPGIIAQCNLNLYDKHFGLNIYRECLPVEDLIL